VRVVEQVGASRRNGEFIAEKNLENHLLFLAARRPTVTRIMNAPERTPKQTKRQQAEAELVRLLDAAQARGFYGTASLTVIVQDGAIQQLKVAVDRMIR
jgi:hypothetical protein